MTVSDDEILTAGRLWYRMTVRIMDYIKDDAKGIVGYWKKNFKNKTPEKYEEKKSEKSII